MTRQEQHMAQQDAAVPEHIRKETDWNKLEPHIMAKTDEEMAKIMAHHSPESIAHATDFYHGGAKAALEYLHNNHGTHPVHAALMLGYTSPSLQPDLNFDVTDKMLARGKGDVLQIPPMNDHKFNEWVEKQTTNGMLHGNRLDKGPHGIKWFEKYGAQLDGPARDHAYYGVEGQWDGKKVHYIVTNASDAKRAALKGRKGVLDKGKTLWVPVSNAAKAADLSSKTTFAKIPKYADPEEDHDLAGYTGALIPSNWTLRGNTIRPALMTHQALIRTLGHDGAAEWLTAQHPYSDLVKMAFRIGGYTGELPKTVKATNELAKSLKVSLPEKGYFEQTGGYPGTALFGPKVGSYVMNLLGHHQYLTMDLWHSRNQAKHVGQSATMKDPKNDKIRNVMYRVMKYVAERYGLSIADAQSLLWHHEQQLHRDAGVPVEATSYRDGIELANSRKWQAGRNWE